MPLRVQAASAEAGLLNLALQALETGDFPSLIESACHQLRSLSGADCTSVVLIDPDSGAGACRVAAGDGWPNDVVGVRIDLPLRTDGSLPLPRSDKGPADKAWAEPPLFTRQGFSDGLWLPIEHDDRTIGWITAHTRDINVLDSTSGPTARTLARILGAALHRDRELRDLKQEAAQARTVCRQLPVLWMSIDTRSGTILDCSAAIGTWLGRTTIDCIGKPAAALFDTTDVAALHETLCRPTATGAEVGVSFRLKHRNGRGLDCVSSGALLGDEGAGLQGPMRVLWVFHERQALQWDAPRSADNDDGSAPREFDWALECDRDRRQQSLRLLNSLRHALHGLRCLFNDGSADVLGSGQATQGTSDRVRALLDQAWQASERAAIALASPNERITDLLSALQRLAEDISESTPNLCVLECSGPMAYLSADAKLAAFRATREFLLQMLNESHTGRITLHADTTAQGFIRLRLARQPEGDGPQAKAQVPLNPLSRGAFGLFAAKTMLAGVGGMLTIAPGQHGSIFVEFQIPSAAPVMTGDIVPANK